MLREDLEFYSCATYKYTDIMAYKSRTNVVCQPRENNMRSDEIKNEIDKLGLSEKLLLVGDI